ncbi:MAG: hypothetical protein ABH952_09315 [Candidatus Omnitrophota bacterium]
MFGFNKGTKKKALVLSPKKHAEKIDKILQTSRLFDQIRETRKEKDDNKNNHAPIFCFIVFSSTALSLSSTGMLLLQYLHLIALFCTSSMQ